MHVAINDRELPPKTLKSINLLNDGLSYTRGAAKTEVDRGVVEKILFSVQNGDIIDYHLRASNNELAKGKARINRISRCTYQNNKDDEVLMFAFELEPLIEKKES